MNVIAPILSEENGPAWKQTIFHPFARVAELAKGQILRLSVDSDTYENARFGGTDLVDVSATWNEESGRVALFFANRGLEEAADVEVALRGFDARRVIRAEVLEIPEGGDRFTANAQTSQDQVGLKPLEGAKASGSELRLTLPALSWAVIELEVVKS
ncbi:intracellular exo-alpha-(1-_5)-L-arabinofuranosidase [Arthrobacter sp. Hiyo4]|nr:intracellular exo-alpha-(1->5)-L-arabinofuranosidase [Arthrobacter sp. Hiyo4]